MVSHTSTYPFLLLLSLGDVRSNAGVADVLLALNVIVEALWCVVNKQHRTADLAYFHRTSLVHLLKRTQHLVAHLATIQSINLLVCCSPITIYASSTR